MISINDERLNYYRQIPKRVTNAKAQFHRANKYSRKQYDAIGPDNEIFEIFLRQNLMPEMHDDFSCGLLIRLRTGESLTLIRYNGGSHPHNNDLEEVKWLSGCHIHVATERYITAGFKAEKYAELTDRFKTLEGALYCMIKDCNVMGIEANPDLLSQIELFP